MIQEHQQLLDSINILYKKTLNNEVQMKRLLRLIYILKHRIKLYEGKQGGLYYKTKHSKIYI